MTNDVARAFFEVPIHREVCIELPAEALEDVEDPSVWVGMLRMGLCGTRNAATNWQEHFTQEMETVGFKRGVRRPCTYYHPDRHISCGAWR